LQKPKEDFWKKIVDHWTLEHEENYHHEKQKIYLERDGEAHVKVKD
jgi:hypothetical protein